MSATAPLMEISPDGGLDLHFHAGQLRAWESTKRIIAVIAGHQSGKTEILPPWLCREIATCGPGDYLAVSPNYSLMERKMLPAFVYFFDTLMRLGQYHPSSRTFQFSAEGSHRTFGDKVTMPTNIFFAYAENPDSLESATGKAAVLDEAGQNAFKIGSWEAIQRRLAIHQGRVLIGTTPYNLGWLKQQVYDPWKAANGNHPYIDVIQFKSIQNPIYPIEEYERGRATLPPWKFRMFYDGEFERPAGLIYDCFDEKTHRVRAFPIPPEWRRFLGLDFGGVNTAGVFFAAEREVSGKETGRLFAYREYLAGSRTAREHKDNLLAGEPMMPRCVGGSHSEDQWRAEFSQAGLPVDEAPITEVEVGIDRVYGAIKRGELLVLDNLSGLLEEIATYSRELDAAGQVTEKIEAKETYHRLDSCRYIISALKTGEARTSIPRAVTGGLGAVPQPSQDTTLGLGRPPRRAGLPFVAGGGIG